MRSSIDSNPMATTQHLTEAAAILARGIVRIKRREAEVKKDVCHIKYITIGEQR